MQVIELGSPEASKKPFRAYVPTLIEHAGGPEFGNAVSRMAKGILGCDQLTAFAFRPGFAPRIAGVFASASEGPTHSAARHYVNAHWRDDPTNIFRTAGLDGGKNYLVFTSQEEVPDERYRHDCYIATGVRYRMSIVRRVQDEFFKVSFHRTSAVGPFQPDRLFDLAEHIDLLCSLIARHERSSPANLGTRAALHCGHILGRRCPQLTNREREVCSLIVAGMSSEAIALELGIGINTVLTFRRRAYARLNISSQNELLRLVYC